jgi:hypothetical protein
MKDTSRAAGQRKVVTLTATIAGLGVAGAVGLAVVASHGTAQAATTTTNTTSGTTSSSEDGSSTSSSGSSQGWQPSGTSLGSGSSHGGLHASSGGS